MSKPSRSFLRSNLVRTSKTRKRLLQIETLETRATPAVNVFTRLNTIVFVGDDQANNISLSIDPNGFLRHNVAGGNIASDIDLDAETAGVQAMRVLDILGVEINAGAGDDFIDVFGAMLNNTAPGNQGVGYLIRGEAGNDTILGANTIDMLSGGDGVDFIVGSGGDDLLVGDTLHFGVGTPVYASDADTILGGVGNDRIYGDNYYFDSGLDSGNGADLIEGGENDDFIQGSGGDDVLYGDYQNLFNVGGNDTIFGGAGFDRLYGDYAGDPWLFTTLPSLPTAGNDNLYGGDDGDSLYGGRGNDVFIGGNGIDVMSAFIEVNATVANNVYTGNGGILSTNHGIEQFLLAGSNGNNVIDCSTYTYGPVRLFGGAGNDTLKGGSGADFIDGGTGDDTLYGFGGNDRIYGDSDIPTGPGFPPTGNDTIYGGAGNDLIIGDTPFNSPGTGNPGGGIGNDRLFGEDGDDFLEGAGGDDTLIGGNGTDSLSGNAGNDFLSGDAGNDLLDAATGNDMLFGGAGADTLRGGSHNDVLVGDAGTDNLDAGGGNDIAIGGLDADTIVGGLGNDVVIGGRTTYDANSTQLNAVRDAWVIGLFTNFDTAVTRVTSGTVPLNATTVPNDAAIDQLWGNATNEVAPGLADLFFSADNDVLRDFQSNDRRRRIV